MGHRPWTWAVLLVAASGCDRVFGLDRPDGGGVDGSASDAGSLCVDDPNVILCATFDEPIPVLHEQGNTFDLPVAPIDLTVGARSPGNSAPNALWIESTTGGTAFSIPADSSASNVTKLTATFSLRVMGDFPTGTTSYGLVRLAFKGLPVDSCYVDLQVFDRVLYLQTQCVSNLYVALTTSLPSASTWTPVTLDINLATMTTSAKIGGAIPKMLTIGAVAPLGAIGHAEFGLFDNHPVGPIVAFDDLVVRAE